MDFHLILEDVQVAELAPVGELPGQASPVPLVVLAGECGHPAVQTVVFPPVLRVPLTRLVAPQVSQPGGSAGKLKGGVSREKLRKQSRTLVEQ